MTREEIKKQWELEFGVKYEDYQRANVYTAVDMLDFAESVVNKLLISGVSQRSELLKVEDKDVSFDFYIDRFFEKPKIQLTYKNKRTKKYVLETKIISDYKRAMCL